MKIGLLPLYITLYDIVDKSFRIRLEKFHREIEACFIQRGIEVMTCDFCMEAPDFQKAVSAFESGGCDALVTLHMAYSPSLNSSEVLKNTSLPIIICDTTEDYDFSPRQSPDEIMYCHGIHGVMDMCNMLRKNGRKYAIAAGHYEKSNVIDKICAYVKAASCSNAIRNARVGLIGGVFEGMGDFQISAEKLKELFGVQVIYSKEHEILEIVKGITASEIAKEKAGNEELFGNMDHLDDAIYTNSVKADIAIKKWIEKNGLTAFSINFRKICELPTMPFNGICKAMSRGIGYAGEGDILTALFTGGLLHQYKETSFIEIFCPDWEHDMLMISHMGEMNYLVADSRPEVFEKPFQFGESANPIVGTASFKKGSGVFINIYEDATSLNAFIAPVQVYSDTEGNFKYNIRGWIKFDIGIASALEKMSLMGVTHHSILVYHADKDEIAYFADLLGLNITTF